MKIKKTVLFSLFFTTCTLFGNDQHEAAQQDKFWGLDSLFSLSPSDIAKTLIKEIYYVSAPTSIVQVQTGSELCHEEKNYLHHRMPIVQDVLQKSFGIDKPLRLGFCCSGGGNRAMIGTLGFLMGAAKSNMLDASLYVAGLSGSTWLISQMCYLAATSYKHQSYEKILTDIKHDYQRRLSDYSMIGINGMYGPPLISFESTDDVFIEVAKRFAYDQELSLVNLFGALVGDYALGLMGNDRLSEKWSNISYEMEKGHVPLPLCSTIFEHPHHYSFPVYEWFEMSPLQCGSCELGYIPVEYLGSGFNKGKLNTNELYYEYPLSFYLGMYGSAFSVSIQDIVAMQRIMRHPVTLFKDSALEEIKRRGLLNNNFIQGFVQNKIQDVLTSRHALTYAQFPNYSQGLSTSILKDQEHLGMFDAGIDFNIPVPALIDRQERDVDVVFLYDSNPADKKQIDEIAAYCQRKGIAFPDVSWISEELLQDNTMTIINDPRSLNYDQHLATYLYFPSNSIDVHSAPYVTFNFKYSAREIEHLTSVTEEAFLSNADEIKEIMKLVAEKRYA